jgi:hypothetical protein
MRCQNSGMMVNDCEWGNPKIQRCSFDHIYSLNYIGMTPIPGQIRFI